MTANYLAQSDSTLSSPVVSINGQDPTAYLQSWSAKISTEHDPDAMYNRLFSGVARNLDTTGNTFSNSAVYPGPFTTLTFENGTTIKKRNIAKVLRDFSGVNSGQSFYTHFLVASDSATADDAPTSTTALLPPPIGYPSPLVRHHLNSVAGYALNSPNNQDVAVLAIPNFSTDGQDIQLFQYVVETFFTEAKTLGKKKLIIDLQSNPGGTVYQGYDVFGQLFPHIALYNAANLRATPDLDLLGQGISDLVGKSFVPETDPANYDLSSQTNQAATAPWSFRHDIKPDGRTPYGSWPEIFGPMMAPHDNLTNLFRENLTDPLTIANGLVVTGTLNRSGFTQPFAAEDIIMLHDGLCGSTCAILSELLKTQAGVRSIAVGGRPQYGPMQAVGGAKGYLPLEFFRPLLTVHAKHNFPVLESTHSKPFPNSLNSPIAAAPRNTKPKYSSPLPQKNHKKNNHFLTPHPKPRSTTPKPSTNSPPTPSAAPSASPPSTPKTTSAWATPPSTPPRSNSSTKPPTAAFFTRGR